MTMLYNFLPDSPSPFSELILLLYIAIVFNSIVFWSAKAIRNKTVLGKRRFGIAEAFFFIYAYRRRCPFLLRWLSIFGLVRGREFGGPITRVYGTCFILLAKATGRPKARLPLEIMRTFSVCLLEYGSGHNKPAHVEKNEGLVSSGMIATKRKFLLGLKPRKCG